MAKNSINIKYISISMKSKEIILVIINTITFPMVSRVLLHVCLLFNPQNKFWGKQSSWSLDVKCTIWVSELSCSASKYYF